MSTTPAAAAPELVPLAACWVCGGTDLARVSRERFDMTWQVDPALVRYHGERFWLVRCGGCGFIQPEGLPADADYFGRLYSKDRGDDWMEADFATPYKDFIFRGILRGLAARLPADRRTLLDVGAHVGRMPYLAARAGWAAEGAELNPAVAAFAARRTGLPVHATSAQELAARGRSFDAVTLTDVLEHIPDPVAVLAGLRAAVRPGGWLAVKVPCGPGQLRKERVRARLGRIPEPAVATSLVHVNHFTPRSLRLALARAGYGRVDLRVGAPEFVFGWRPGRLASAAFRVGVYAAARLAPGGVHTPLALNLQAFARFDG